MAAARKGEGIGEGLREVDWGVVLGEALEEREGPRWGEWSLKGVISGILGRV